MATDTSFQNQYRQEFVAQFEQKMSYFRASATNDVVHPGNRLSSSSPVQTAQAR